MSPANPYVLNFGPNSEPSLNFRYECDLVPEKGQYAPEITITFKVDGRNGITEYKIFISDRFDDYTIIFDKDLKLIKSTVGYDLDKNVPTVGRPTISTTGQRAFTLTLFLPNNSWKFNFNNFYYYRVVARSGRIDANNQTLIYITYIETLRRSSSTNDENGALKLIPLQNNVEVPEIFINAQTLVDASDMGESIFKIYDKYSYYKNIANDNNGICKIKTIDDKDLIETNFVMPCIKISNTIIGHEKGLREKIVFIWNNVFDKKEDKGFYEFFDDFIKYTMVRYLLSKILYGKFNSKYLLKKYYNKFITDLGKSRFCNFLTFFNDPDFSEMYKYFL
jgi:hypothetical protein